MYGLAWLRCCGCVVVGGCVGVGDVGDVGVSDVVDIDVVIAVVDDDAVDVSVVVDVDSYVTPSTLIPTPQP